MIFILTLALSLAGAPAEMPADGFGVAALDALSIDGGPDNPWAPWLTCPGGSQSSCDAAASQELQDCLARRGQFGSEICVQRWNQNSWLCEALCGGV